MNEITTQAVNAPVATQSDAVLAAICFDANGLVPVPTGPGLGITVNEDLIRRYGEST